MFHELRRIAVWLPVTLIAFLIGAPADAQLFRGRRALPPEPEAIAGAPFGVGRLSVRLPDARPGLFGERDFTLTDAQGRVFYAAFDFQPVRAILREVLNRPQTVTVHFLFTGEEPLDLELFAASSVRMRVVPRRDPGAHDRLLAQWWEQYTDAAARAARTNEYPQLVDGYLLSMLSQRLDLAPPQIDRRFFPQPDLEQSLGVLLGTESIRLKVQDEVMSGANRAAGADNPLPKPIAFPEVIAPDVKDVKIEAIALHVPEECFYVRFGNFPNYLWFSRLLREFGGELRNLVAMRGLDYQLNARQEQQLALKESALAELLGPQVIADVALVGQDMFLREGAAMGILFQARNNFGLSADIRSQRTAALAANKDAEETSIDVAGHKVSFLSTPDNRIRSFYAVDGDFHFVTTSRTLVQRFYEAGAGQGALGKSAEFRLARAEVPIAREDSVFAYMSSAFFENLLSPHYRIEITRRLRSTVEIDLVKMARLAASNEGRPHDTLDDLVRGGFLPPEIGQRSDGSRLIVLENGDVVDSVRGRSGSFTPVPDIAFDTVTVAETRDYRQFADTLTARWQRIDPIVVAAKRFAGEAPQFEQVALDVRMTPLAADNYSMLMNFVGPPSIDRLAPLRGNVATVEAVTRGRGPEPVHLYAGALDTGIPFKFADDMLGGLRAMLNLKFYFGGWPSAGMFSFFGLRDDLPVDRNGFGRPSALLWQRTDGPFVTGSTDPDVLADVTPRFRIVEAERPAQFWLQLGDLNRSELATLINGYGYFRARQITGGNLRFMHRLSTQLGVAAQDAQSVAQDLAGGQLVCALGGEFKLDEPRGGLATWYSTGWDRDASRLITSVPRGFTTPPLDWLRGAELDAALTPQELSAHAIVVMHRRAPPTATAPTAGAATASESILPAFPFKGLDWFGGKQENAETDKPSDKSTEKLPVGPKTQPEELPEPAGDSNGKAKHRPSP
ncbi:MAG: hypothetical protein WD894_03440 [Pirellulales bacterium]